MNVWQNTTLGNGDMSEKLVQFFIVADSELKMTRNDTGLLVVTSGITSQFEDFGGKILKDGSEIDRSTSADTLSIVALSEETVNTADWERESGLGRAALGALSTGCGLASRFTSSHFD